PSSLPAPSASLQPLRSSTLGDAAGELTEMRADRRARDQRSEIRKLGKALDQLPEGKIFLHAPIKMKVADRLTVAARIGVDVREDLLKGHVRAGDQTAEGSLRVAHRMIATLSGAGFDIKATTPEQQTVAEGFPTVWEWDIEAKTAGAQELKANFYVLLADSPGISAPHPIPTSPQKIHISLKAHSPPPYF